MKRFKELIKERTYLVEALQKVGGQLGSNEGGVYADDETGKKFYVKHYRNADQAKVEDLTSKIYEHMGINTLRPTYSEMNGKPTIATEWNEKLRLKDPSEFNHLNDVEAHQLAKMYHAAILTKNWDIIGMEHDNVMQHENGDMYAVDHGGAFHFRAQGAPKEYGPDINEHASLRSNPGASGRVFSSLFQKHPQAEHRALEAVKGINDDYVETAFRNSGLDNWKELHHNFKQRKENLLRHYGE